MTTAIVATIGVGGAIVLLIAILAAPIVIGGVAGHLLGYSFAYGAGAGLAFSMIAGAVRGIVGMAVPQPA